MPLPPTFYHFICTYFDLNSRSKIHNLEFIYFRDLDGPYWMACMGQCLGGNAVEKGLTPKFIHPMTKTLCNDNFCFCDGGCGPCGGCWTCCRPCNSCRCCDCNGGDCCHPIGCRFTNSTIY